jgi:3-hydroxyisobutyrate dehydrogenase-like beta-hydroxyacid dehydrogenase
VIAIIGLGPIGAGVASALNADGRETIGLDRDFTRVEQFSHATGGHATSRAEEINWQRIELAIIAVRLAEHLPSAFNAMARRDIPTLVLTTLSVADAKELARFGNRVIEAPVSGGSAAARSGSLTIFVHAPSELNGAELSVINAIAARTFTFDHYGLPAAAKLTNNTLAAFNAFAVEATMEIAARMGIRRGAFLDIINASSGQSWMAEHFDEFPQDLLFKDVALLERDVNPLPVLSLANVIRREGEILAARTRIHVESGTTSR